jgi:hypothetical protein
MKPWELRYDLNVIVLNMMKKIANVSLIKRKAGQKPKIIKHLY